MWKDQVRRGTGTAVTHVAAGCKNRCNIIDESRCTITGAGVTAGGVGKGQLLLENGAQRRSIETGVGKDRPMTGTIGTKGCIGSPTRVPGGMAIGAGGIICTVMQADPIGIQVQIGFWTPTDLDPAGTGLGHWLQQEWSGTGCIPTGWLAVGYPGVSHRDSGNNPGC